jgi:hypothetical protein
MIYIIYKIDYIPHVCCKLVWGLSILKVSCNFQTLGDGEMVRAMKQA